MHIVFSQTNKNRLPLEFNTDIRSDAFDRLNLYERCLILQDSSAYFLINNEAISAEKALEIGYAMRLKLPIVMSREPQFTKNVPLFHRELFSRRLNKILICSFDMLDATDMQSLIEEVLKGPVSYGITKHEHALVRSYLKAQLRG